MSQTSPVHESEKLSRQAADLAHHGFDLAQRLHEALVVCALWLRDSELSLSEKPSEYAPSRRARHRTHGYLDKRCLALRKEKAGHATLHAGGTTLLASLLEFLPDQLRKATALGDSFLDIVAIGIQRRRTPSLGRALGECPRVDELLHGYIAD
ncbi:hypothetical protein C265_15142 [Cupriavidus sp. GA3-3]|nr:hypothetical protein C265_15142 [Cupriavidus sp. GA3-3]